MIATVTLHPDILSVIDSIDLLSDTAYTLQGMQRDIQNIRIEDPARTLSGEGPMTPEQKFINVLTTDIYNNLYHANPATKEHTPVYGTGSFIASLSHANHGTGAWETGWEWIGEDAAGKQIVQKNVLRFRAEKEDVRRAKDGSCMVKVSKECRHLNAHFYYAYGNTDKTRLAGFEDCCLRFYWNIRPSAAVSYIDAVTTLLNRSNIHFTTKVLSDPAAYTRSDAAVLYIDRSQLGEVLAMVPLIHERITGGLRTAVPLFTRQLLPGIGFAEDPANGLSFGISRCRLIAATLYDCALKRLQDRTHWEDALERSFALAGIAALHPYASADSAGYYESLIIKHSKTWK